MRDTLLLSHANPEDNEFTLWLALQLANDGYRVWCDLTKLLGGEVIMALTKLNHNACLFADGSPITLKFANAVGEVLTAGPVPSGGAPLPFMYYI
ncbi:MAG TPA: hypothetical protein VFE61_19295 [Candidatus Sulfotelmatobacter sp.]|jgi:hypothetical protein|nr:hypothetical protein [Candidatus Sulfotelmatobacter sp.]